jgi:integrase/recombinase XerD
MSALAPTLQAFFTDRLTRQRDASPNTIAAYRDTWRLLLGFVADQIAKPPSQLDLADLDAEIIAAFLDHLEHDRGNGASTRNARLAAIRSLFRFAALRHPEHAADIERVLAIPTKRTDRPLVSFLTDQEIDALLAAPDLTTWFGRRDRALLTLAIQTGLRISELTGLHCADLHLGTGAYVACHGKGRKDRTTPLTRASVTVLEAWLTERAGRPDDPLFPTRQGVPLTRDAFERRLKIHTARAVIGCPSLAAKTITAHVLRHTAAMRLLHAGIDTSVIALWLGHENVETTQIYLRADLTLKERAINRTTPPRTPPGRYRPDDTTLAFLDSL